MSKRIPITQFFPLEIARWRDSIAVQKMRDYQRAWYLHLLMTAWLNIDRPCHLSNDVTVLWKLAGSATRQGFDQNSQIVLSQFRLCQTGWLCNVNSLRIYIEKLCTYYRDKVPAEILIFLLNDCTCLSKEEKERLRGNDGRNIDTEQLTRAIRNLGFRDSQSITVEHSIADVLSSGESGTDLLDTLRKIYIWTESGVYAPKLHEVIRRWKEPQHLWERKETKKRAYFPPTMASSSISYSDYVRCCVCSKGLGPRLVGDDKNDLFVCSDECAAKSGYEVAP